MERIAEPPKPKHTQYGRACVTCVRAKAKCVLSPDGNTGCERCVRLNRECQPSPAVRKRPADSREPRTSTKVARLEEKLDNLVSLIKSNPQTQSAAVNQNGDNSRTPEAFALTPNSNTTDNSNTLTSQSSLPINELQPVACGSFGSHIPQLDSDHPCAKSMSHLDNNAMLPNFNSSQLSTEDADEALILFRSHMLRHYPIIAIPTGLNAHGLKAQSPFLWLCIMAVSLKSSKKQKSLGMEIRRVMANRIILEGDRTVDLLSGLLVYAGWSQYYIWSKPIITNVVQLSVALLGDLGLNKPALKEPLGIMLEYDTRGCPKPINPSPRTLAERRSAIACFSIGQAVAVYWQRVEPVRWTPYFDECLEILLENKDDPGDMLLANIVKTQLIIEKVGQAPWSDQFTEKSDTAKAPALPYVNAISAQMQDFKQRLPAELNQSQILNLSYHKAEVVIHEVSLLQYPLSPSNSDFHRLDLLWKCLQATKNWFELFLEIPPSQYIGLPMWAYSSIAHSMAALHRLSTFEHPGWDLSLVRETCNLSEVLGRICHNFTLVKPIMGLDPESQEDISMFAAAYRRTFAVKQWCEARLNDTPSSTSPSALPMNLNDMLPDFSDDAWLKEVCDDNFRWDGGPFRQEE